MFKLSRGVRQGCSLSPYLFVLSAEILVAKIRQNNLIKGIILFGNEANITNLQMILTYFVLILFL